MSLNRYLNLGLLGTSLDRRKDSSLKHTYRKYNLVFFVAVLSPLLSVALFNIAIDPYGVFDSPKFSGLNASKPEKGNRDRLFKAIDIIRIKPATVVLGSSRTRQGLNPLYPALKSHQPAYNVGLNGVNPYEELRYLEQAITNNKNLKLVIIGIDFFMFNAFNQNQVGFSENRLERKSIALQDIIDTTFSLDAFNSSKDTIIANNNGSEKQGDSFNGFMPYRNIDLEEDITQWRFKNSWDVYFNLHSNYQFSSRYLKDFKTIVDICKQQGITLKVFISPSHATDGEAIRVTGHWATLEKWKREVVKIVPVWDFSGYNSITTEPIGAGMQNYADSSHYREEVGNLIISRLLSYQEDKVPKDFGSLMTPDNIESHLTKIRAEREVWLKNNSEVVKLIEASKRKQDKKQKSVPQR